MKNNTKPKNYWTFEKCKEEALKYEKIKDFSNNSPYVYKISCKNNWINEITPHIKKLKQWSYENCIEEVKKFNYLCDFIKNSNSCYSAIHKKGWIEELCSHMIRKEGRGFKIDKELCKKESLKYKTRKEFREKCASIYNYILKNNWLEELCSHQECQKTNGFWTKDKCYEKALECKTNKEFKDKYPSAYSSALKNKWLCDIRGHFEAQGNLYKRFIYAYEFPDNHVYVGLTCNIVKRKQSHLLRGTVFNYCVKSNLKPLFIQISTLPIEAEEAKKQEGYYLNEYISNGWIPLNKVKVGALGATKVKWTVEKLQEEALKYTTKKEFRKNSESAYSTAKKHKIINEVCKHMNCKERKANNYWTYERCKEKALEYSCKKDFRIGSNTAYNVAKKNNWLGEFCIHMNNKYISRYTIEEFKQMALPYSSIKQFNKENRTCYVVICKNKWNNYVFSHIKKYNRDYNK